MQQDELVCMPNRVLFVSVTTIKLILILIVNTCKNHRTSFNSNTCKKLIVIVSIVNSMIFEPWRRRRTFTNFQNFATENWIIFIEARGVCFIDL